MTSLPIVSRFWSSRRTSKLSHAPDLHALWQYPRLLPKAVATDPLVQHYLDLLGPLNWSQFPERDLLTQRGMPAVPFVPFVAACLVKLDQHLRYFSHLRQYLLDHPSLSWTLGFPALSPAKTTVQLPSQRHFPRLLRKVPNVSLQFLLDETVRLLRQELVVAAPDFGDTVALDTKHILAWVRENNPRDYVKDRFAKDHQPADPDCALGCKRKRNQRTQTVASPPTPNSDPLPAPTIAVSEYYWGYASGIVTTKVPGISDSLADQVARIVRSIRQLELKKSPSVSETLDWANTLMLLGVEQIDEETAAGTANILLKYQSDIAKAVKEFAADKEAFEGASK